MKYTVTVRVINEFSIEISSIDEESACDKAQVSWEKISPIEINHQKTGNFEHQEENIEFEAEEQ